MNSGNRKPTKTLILIASVFALTAPTAMAQAGAVNGHWADKNNPNPYESFVKIEGSKGFYCVLDDKSSFTFNIIGDSITTPMNGMDKIRFFPGSGDIEISGEEKGDPYSTRFAPIGDEAYPAGCAEREASESGTGIAKHRIRNGRFSEGTQGMASMDILGRTHKARGRSASIPTAAPRR